MTIQKLTVDWTGGLQRVNMPGLGPTDVLAVKFITGPAVPEKSAGHIGNANGYVMLQGCLSLTEGDFDSPIDKSPLGPSVTITEYFSLTGTNPSGAGWYPVIPPATPVYFNLRCFGQDQDWGGVIEFEPPQGIRPSRR